MMGISALTVFVLDCSLSTQNIFAITFLTIMNGLLLPPFSDESTYF
jgi:hypothetical protein